jgi:glycolate oxidase FAD binding subunit
LLYSISIDDFGPLSVERPKSVAECGEIIRRIGVENRAIYPVGGGTMLGFGLTPTKQGIAVDLRDLNQMIDYPARDMTITVQAGITVERLQEVLKSEGQQLPVDVPLPERATLGGAIATNVSGPRRLGYGTLRDYVIGISVLNDRGEEVKGGGRVVKNVAGYDFMKLYTSSLGTLGIITQITLKVKPLPEAASVVTLPCTSDNLVEVLRRIANSATRPTMVSVANASAAALVGSNSPAYSVAVGYEEKAATVAWQVSKLNTELPAELTSRASEFQGDLAGKLVRQWTGFPLAAQRGLTFKANLLPAATAEFLIRADRLAPRPALLAHAANGIVFGHLPEETTLDQAKAIIVELTQHAVMQKGNVVITRCPAAWKAVLPVWGMSTPDRVLMRAVKNKLDPSDVFNPGRFVDGI